MFLPLIISDLFRMQTKNECLIAPGGSDNTHGTHSQPTKRGWCDWKHMQGKPNNTIQMSRQQQICNKNVYADALNHWWGHKCFFLVTHIYIIYLQLLERNEYCEEDETWKTCWNKEASKLLFLHYFCIFRCLTRGKNDKWKD